MPVTPWKPSVPKVDWVIGALASTAMRTSTLPGTLGSNRMSVTLPTGTPLKRTEACRFRPLTGSRELSSNGTRTPPSRLSHQARATSNAATTSTKVPAARAWALFSIGFPFYTVKGYSRSSSIARWPRSPRKYS